MKSAVQLFVDIARDNHRQARAKSDSKYDVYMKEWLLGRRSAFMHAARLIKKYYSPTDGNLLKINNLIYEQDESHKPEQEDDITQAQAEKLVNAERQERFQN